MYQSSTRTSQTQFILDGKNEIFPRAAGINAGYIAQTNNWVSSNLLTEADSVINVSYPIANDPVAPTSYSLRALIAHEMGHMIGLDHSNNTKNTSGQMVTSFANSIMFSGQPTGPVNYGLRLDDINSYNHIPW